MAEYQEKFIVVNGKHLTLQQIGELLTLLETFKLPNNKYYVCNQDEPYAPRVIKTILDGEDQKANPVDAVVSPKIAGKKRRLKVITSQQQFEEFTNSDIEIIDIDVKAVEQSYICQDCFIAVIQYYESNFTG